MGSPHIKTAYLVAAVLLTLLTSYPVLAVAAEPDLSGLAFTQRPGSHVPLDTVFTDQAGNATTLRMALGGRPAVLQLGYFACPALCGLSRDDTLAALAASGLRAGGDYSFVFVAIDPAETPHEAAAALRLDAASHPVPGNSAALSYLTGPSAALASAVGFPSRWDAVLKQFLHPSGIVVLTADGTVSSYLLGIGYAPADMRAALVQAGRGVVAAPAANPILLLCFHYDSTTGRYTLAVMKVLRLLGGVTVVAVAGTILWLRWGERRRA